MKTICICISTRNRPKELKRMLDSLLKLSVDYNLIKEWQLVVVENNKIATVENIVKNHPLNNLVQTNYFIENKIGIVYSRNKAVKYSINFDYSLFIDDDQTVKSDLLNELVSCLNEFKADAVYGNNPPIFDKNLPKIRNYYNKFFNRNYPGVYGSIIERAPTNCLMISNDWLNMIAGPFDLRFNLIGGEDTFLTNQLVNLGMKMVRNPQAIAYENIPLSRCNIKYILQRTYSSSNSRTMQYLYLPKSKTELLKRLLFLFLKLFLGITMSIPILVFYPNNRIYGLRKIAESTGGIFVLFGSRYDVYKTKNKSFF